MPERIPLNRGWEFTETFSEAFLRGEGAGETVCLPHTCREVPYSYFDDAVYQMDCAYRRRLTVPESWAGKRVFLLIGAAGHRARVYLDGARLSEHKCGYTAFRTELAGLVPGKEALLTVEVDSRESVDQPPFGFVIDYLTFGGLYREVWLEIAEQTFIDDLFVKTDGAEKTDTVVSLAGPLSDKMRLRQTIRLRGEEKPLSEKRFLAVAPRVTLRAEVPGARPWDLESPVLYEMTVELLDGDRVLDKKTVVFGFRRAEFRADGFYLNGRKVKLRGLNRHQSYPYAGYAMPASLQRLDADILKNELGVNAVRTSHYPQSPHFIDRCDELGLLVFTEIPGWQHIGGEDWKNQAVENVGEMVTQYRNHPSVILWGVRINESADDDELYARTNALAHRLDPTRPTGGVRCIKHSHLLEDVYTYNDFIHDGKSPGCEKKKNVTDRPDRPYLISEYNGHMFPTKTWDAEEHRLEHALRHARVLDAVAGEEDVAGSFGWCMFDYNTHRDFGSGDRICYHGVTDMFRNPKLAAAVYAAQGDRAPVLEVSSAMDIGEHPASILGRTYLFTNADEVRMYKNDRLICTCRGGSGEFPHLARPPIELEDFIGDQLEEQEGFSHKQAELTKDILNYSARFGSGHLPPEILAKAGFLMARYRMTMADASRLFSKYVGDWGQAAREYRFEAVKDGKVVSTVVKAPVRAIHLTVNVDHTDLREGDAWDAASLRIAMRDQNGNVLPFWHGDVQLETEGPIALIGPAAATLRGGYGGTYVKTLGRSGPAAVTLTAEGAAPVRIEFTVTAEE